MRLRALGFITALSLGFLSAPLAPEAQQPAKIPRIGLLWPNSLSVYQQRLEVFRHGLRELGYV